MIGDKPEALKLWDIYMDEERLAGWMIRSEPTI